MARKKLNKKVAFIGSAIFIILVLGVIAIVLRLTQDPQKFIEDGDAARLVKDYEKAEYSYHKARSLAKSDELRVEILFKLSDLLIEEEKWNNVLGSWQAIIKLEPRNVKARYAQLKYFYIMADNGMFRVWKEIYDQASEFLENADAELLSQNPDQFDVFEFDRKAGVKELGTYLHLLKGRAMLQMVMGNEVADADESLAQAVEDLEKVRQLEVDNIEVYWYLAQATSKRGQIFASRGNLEEESLAQKEAEEFLVEAVSVAGDDPRAKLNLLRVKFSRANDIEQLKEVEAEYLAVAEEFSSDARVYSALVGFYQSPLLGYKYLDNAIEAVEKAKNQD